MCCLAVTLERYLPNFCGDLFDPSPDGETKRQSSPNSSCC